MARQHTLPPPPSRVLSRYEGPAAVPARAPGAEGTSATALADIETLRNQLEAGMFEYQKLPEGGAAQEAALVRHLRFILDYHKVVRGGKQMEEAVPIAMEEDSASEFLIVERL